jgi:hypothetical protein
MIDLGEYDARKTTPTNDEGVFTRHRARMDRINLAAYIADYIQEELGRGVSPNDIGTWLIADALDAYDGGAR